MHLNCYKPEYVINVEDGIFYFICFKNDCDLQVRVGFCIEGVLGVSQSFIAIFCSTDTQRVKLNPSQVGWSLVQYTSEFGSEKRIFIILCDAILKWKITIMIMLKSCRYEGVLSSHPMRTVLICYIIAFAIYVYFQFKRDSLGVLIILFLYPIYRIFVS